MGLAVLMLANVSPAEAVALHGGTPTAIGGHSGRRTGDAHHRLEHHQR